MSNGSNVNINVNANTGSAVGALSQLNQSLTHVGTTVNTVSSRLYRMGHTIQEVGQNMYSIGQNATIGISMPLALLGKKLIETGSSMKAMHSTFQTVFGDVSDEAQAWSKEMSKSVGLSAGIIDKTNLEFAKMGGAFGLTGNDALEFSKKWTKMTLDLAAFNDVSIEDATDRIKSGLRGEADAVESLGIFMGEANLSQQLMTMGIKDQWSELDMVTKQQVLYALATKQTAQAQGQASRESSSYQNSLANLKQTFAEFAEKFYKVVEPAVLDFMNKLNELALKFQGLTDDQIKLWAKVAIGLIVIPPLIMYIGATIEAFGRLFKLLAFGSKGFGLMVSGFRWIGVEMALLPTRLGVYALEIQAFMARASASVMNFMMTTKILGLSMGWITIIATVLAVVGYLVYKNWDQIKVWTIKTWTDITAWLSNEWEYIKKAASSAWTAITGFFSNIWADIVAGFNRDVMPVVNGAKEVFGAVANEVMWFVKVIWSILSFAGKWIRYIVMDIIVPIVQYVGGFFLALGQMVVYQFKAIVGMVFNWLAEKWNWLYSNVFLPVGNGIIGVFKAIGQWFSDVYNNHISPMIDGVSSKWSDMSSSVSNEYDSKVVPMWDSIKNAIKVVGDKWDEFTFFLWFKWQVFVVKIHSIWNSIAIPVMNGITSVTETVKSAWNSVWEGAGNVFNDFVAGVKETWAGIKSVFKLPHFSVSGSWDLTPPDVSAPDFNVDWYAKGGLFNGASVIGVGEAGSEAVLPLTNSRTMSMLGAKVAEYMPDSAKNGIGSGNGVVIQVNGLVVREEADIEKIGQELYKQQQRESRRLGRSGR